MPIDVVVDAEQHLATFTARGSVSTALIIEALERFWNDPHYRPTMHRLWDCRDATVTWSNADVQALVELFQRYAAAHTTGRAAFVMGSPAAYGIVRMMQIYAEIAGLPPNLEVFSSLDEALAWLGVRGEPPADPI
jgi:hypothetical protein